MSEEPQFEIHSIDSLLVAHVLVPYLHNLKLFRETIDNSALELPPEAIQTLHRSDFSDFRIYFSKAFRYEICYVEHISRTSSIILAVMRRDGV